MPNKSENVLVEDCIFNHSGSSIDIRMWKKEVVCGPLIVKCSSTT